MKKRVLGVKKDIFLLGIVSFLTDVSSEMIFSVFSIFFTVILGASILLFALAEGLADFSASSLDYISGVISEKTGKKKIFTVFGYGFSTAAKLIIAFKSTIPSAFVFRVIERFGKSIRGPPRDAWIGAIAEKSNRGYSFAMHKSLDRAGAILGPLIAFFVLSRLGETLSSFKVLFQIALIPAILSVVLLFIIKDKPSKPQKINLRNGYKNLSKELKHYIFASAVFSLAYFSFSFLLLKAYLVGFQIKEVALLYMIFNLSLVIASPIIGKVGDKIGRKKIITLEYIIYFIISTGFIFAYSKYQVIILLMLFGVFYAIDESQSKAYITDLEKKKRAVAIGTYNFIMGLIYLPASLIAAALWKIDPNYTFVFASVISLVALVLFMSRTKR